MKISFVGKGGSGKTTISSIFIKHLTAQGKYVLAIDADINQHLQQALGFTHSPAPLGINALALKKFLRGSNTNIEKPEEMIKTTPPGFGSKLLRLNEENEVWQKFALQKDNLKFVATGPFAEEDLGVKCYHSKVGAAELLLNHLVDLDEEYVITDMTAGADTFASGMFTRFDITFIVVEPTLKSVSVFEQYLEYAKDFDLQIFAVGNKVKDEKDIAFLQSKLGEKLVCAFTDSPAVRAAEQGEKLGLEKLEEQNIFALKTIQQLISTQTKDWDLQYKHAVLFHEKNCISWANAEHGKDLRSQISKDFSLKTYIQN